MSVDVDTLDMDILDVDTVVTDLNGVLMFGHDRLDDSEDFASTYRSLGGTQLSGEEVNKLVVSVVGKLYELYENRVYDERFPSVASVAEAETGLPDSEIELLTGVVAHHEMGVIEQPVIDLLVELSLRYKLVLLSNLWSDSSAWLAYFDQLDITRCFAATVFSSDYGINKPSQALFRIALEQSNAEAAGAVMIGDSFERDIVPAKVLGMKTIWITQTLAQAGLADVTLAEFRSVGGVLGDLSRDQLP